MENFKVNDHNKIEQRNNLEEFEDFKFDNLENLSSETKQEIEITQEHSKNEAFENLNDIYARAERYADRENGSFFARDDEIQKMNIIHFEDYDANFETYEGRGNEFVLRKNQFKSQDQLTKEIETIKSSPRQISVSQKFSNFSRALFGRI